MKTLRALSISIISVLMIGTSPTLASGYDDSSFEMVDSSENSFFSDGGAAIDGDNETYSQLVVDACDSDCTDQSFIQLNYYFSTSFSEVESMWFEWNIYPYDTFTPRNSTTHFYLWDYDSGEFDSMEVVHGSLSEWEWVEFSLLPEHLSSSGEIKASIHSEHDDTSESGSELAIAVKEFHIHGTDELEEGSQSGEQDDESEASNGDSVVDVEPVSETPASGVSAVLLAVTAAVICNRRN